MNLENPMNPDTSIPQINDDPPAKVYMGDLTSQEIGNFARAGALGGEMVRRMVESQEQQLMQDYEQNKLQ